MTTTTLPISVPATTPAPGEDAAAVTPATEVATLESVPTELFIAGEWRRARSGETLAVEDPATGETLTEVADAAEADCLDALAAADAARATWAATAPAERSRIISRAAAFVREESERLALVLTVEMGKPLAESRAEVEFAAEYLEWYAGEATRIGGHQAIAPNGQSQHIVTQVPVGVTLAITPWNFPIAVPARVIGPALAAGCTQVLRVAAATPLSALCLAEIFQRAGLPAGVLNVVVSSTDDATDALVTDPRLRKLSFTGSEPVGRHLAGLAATRSLSSSMELGGNAPLIVFADADLDVAVEQAVAAKMRNGAMACTAANRIYVEQSIAPEFTRRFTERMAEHRLGRGTRKGATLGPMIGERQRRRFSDLVDDAIARGASVELAGGPLPGPGHFVRPVVLSDVPEDARCMQEEIFGPLAPITTFTHEAEVIARANARSQGLAAYLFTSDLARAIRVGPAIEAGMIGLNRGRVSDASAPFGGTKGSGDGRSGGHEGIEEYTETRYLTLPLEMPGQGVA